MRGVIKQFFHCHVVVVLVVLSKDVLEFIRMQFKFFSRFIEELSTPILCRFLTVDNLVTVAPPAHAKLHCIRFGSDVLCQVKCNNGYVSDPERPHANSYIRREGKWTTHPEGMKFPWADCVLG